jgi:hypothetical protein
MHNRHVERLTKEKLGQHSMKFIKRQRRQTLKGDYVVSSVTSLNYSRTNRFVEFRNVVSWVVHENRRQIPY